MSLNIDQLKKKIIYRSNYRGTKEMDKLLGAFTKKHINQFFLFKSGKNLNTNGQLKIKEIVNQLDKKFKNKINLNVNLNEDKVINYS